MAIRTVLILSVLLNLILGFLWIGGGSGLPAEGHVADRAVSGARAPGPTDRQDVVDQIQAMVDRETRAWDHEDVALLLSIFHPDMVWPWPSHPEAHDPVLWKMEMGRFDHERWSRVYQDLFSTHDVVHNRRETVSILVSDQEDAAFAVVDIDTLWRDDAGNDFLWKGRVGKGYTRVQGVWKLIFHTGALAYDAQVEGS